MSDEHHVARVHVLQGHRDGLVGPLADLGDGLAARATVRPDQPVGHRLADLVGRGALVVAVVPLGQQRGDLVDLEPGQFGGHQRPAPWAADHQRLAKLQVGQRLLGQPGLLAALFGEVQFGAAGVLTGHRPFGFAMSKQQQSMLLDTHPGDSAPRRRRYPARVLG